MTDNTIEPGELTDDQQRRIHDLIAVAVNGLTDEDRNERIAHCQTHNEHGVRMHITTADDLLEFRWGGRTLALVPRADLLGDGPLTAEFIPDVPDTIPDDL